MTSVRAKSHRRARARAERSHTLGGIFQDLPEIRTLFSELDPFSTHRRATRTEVYARSPKKLPGGKKVSRRRASSSIPRQVLPASHKHLVARPRSSHSHRNKDLQLDTIASITDWITTNRDILRDDLQRAHDLQENPDLIHNPEWIQMHIKEKPPSYESLLQKPPPTYRQAMKRIRKKRAIGFGSGYRSMSSPNFTGLASMQMTNPGLGQQNLSPPYEVASHERTAEQGQCKNGTQPVAVKTSSDSEDDFIPVPAGASYRR